MASKENPNRVAFQLRWCDTDALGHVNNTVFAQMSEHGRVGLFDGIGQKVDNLILARLSIDFVAQVHLESEVEVLTWVERIGRSSITMGQRVVLDGETTAAEMECVIVYFDYDAQSTAPVPDAWRAALGH